MPDNSTTPGIEINITGNIDGLRDAMNQATREARTFSNSGITPLVSSLQNAYNAQRNFQRSLSAGNLTIRDSRGVFVNARTAINSTTDATARLASSTNRTGQVVTNFGRILSDLPFGFIAIQNNIDPLVASLGLGAGLGLAFTIAGAAATTLIQKYGSLSNAYDALFGNLTATEKAQKQLNKAQEEGSKNSDVEIAHLSALYTAAQNVNIPISEREKIVRKLQEQYPSYFGNLNKEILLTGRATEQYNKLRDSIIANATSKAIDEEIGANAKSLRDLQKEYKDLVRNQLAAANRAEDIRREIDNFKIDDANNSTKELFQRFQKSELERQFKSAQQAVESYNRILSKNKEAQADVMSQSKSLADEQQKLAASFTDVLVDIDSDNKGSKKIKTVSDILAEMRKELSGVDTEAQLLGGSIDNLNGERIKIIKSAFDELKTILPPTNSELQKLAKELERLGAAQIGEKTIGIRLQDSAKQLRKTDVTKGLGLDIDLVNVDQNQKNLNDTIDKLKKDTEDKISKTTIKWGNISSGLGAAVVDVGTQFRALATNMASGLGEVIAGVVSGGDSLGKSLYKLVGVMASFLKDFGRSLIEAATLKIIAEKTLLSNPYVALAAGVAAIAVGSLLQNKMPSFATGGGVYAPTVARIGDNPGREEYVIPSEVLDKLSNRRATTNITGIIRGNDILLVTNRSARSNVRINGV